MKGGDILVSRKGGILEKGGGDPPYQLVQLVNFSDHTPCVMNVGDCISCCRLQVAFLYHEKHSLRYVLSIELYVKLSPYYFVNIVKFWCKYL